MHGVSLNTYDEVLPTESGYYQTLRTANREEYEAEGGTESALQHFLILSLTQTRQTAV